MYLIKSVKGIELVPGITGHYVHGEKLTFGYVELRVGSVIPEHQHPHEQITYILEGQLDMIIDGIACSLLAGMFYVIPPNVRHSAVSKVDSKVIDVFSPPREDYR